MQNDLLLMTSYQKAMPRTFCSSIVRMLSSITTFCVFFVVAFSCASFFHSERALAASARQNYYAESTGESSAALTSYQDKTTLTFTPDANSSYVIIASWLMQESSTSGSVYGKLTRTTGTAKDFNELIYLPKDATDYMAGGCVGVDSYGASPASQTYKIQYKSSSTFYTARIKEAKIIAIKLTSQDNSAVAESRTTTTGTGYSDKTTLTFTPESVGDYILLASATGDGASTSYDFRERIDVDGTQYSTTNIEPAATANCYPWTTIKRVNLSASSHTIKIQYSTENATAAAGIAHARVVALRADRFSNNYYAESEGRSTTTSTSYQTKTTLTQTPQAADHLILGEQGLDGSDTGYSTYGQLLKGATSYGEMLVEPKDATNRVYQYFAIKKETLTNTSTSWYLQYKSENNSATAGTSDARIAVIDLREPSITVGTAGTQKLIVPPNALNFYVGGAFTLVRESASASVTSITVRQTGTITDANISGLILYYKQEASCSNSIPGDATQFNSSPGSFSSGSSTVTGTMSVGTSQICVYVEVDVGAASNGNTIEIQITNPSSQVTASMGTVLPASAVLINGTTTVTVGSGVLSTNIVDAGYVSVANPSVAMSAATVSLSCGTSTGTFGTSSQQIYVNNDDGADAGWSLTIAASSPTAVWDSAGIDYDFNDPISSGCGDGGDTDLLAGQLTLNPAVGTLAVGQCGSCTTTNITKGSSSAFSEGVLNSVTLLTGSAASDDIGDWTLRGVSISQTIPASQPSASDYRISLTITVTAL